ncbi:MAG TPA: hypothetical protein DCS74_02255 [Veillonellaceae bacterium]|jgi:hypothetical protein|nr:hypothetical protein [Veillonellaceae bacterium]
MLSDRTAFFMSPVDRLKSIGLLYSLYSSTHGLPVFPNSFFNPLFHDSELKIRFYRKLLADQPGAL